MNEPPRGIPSPTSFAKLLMLKFSNDVLGVTTVWLLKFAGWLNSRKTYLRRESLP